MSVVYVLRTDDYKDELYWNWDEVTKRYQELKEQYKKEGRKKAAAYYKRFESEEEAKKAIELGKKHLRIYDPNNLPDVYAFTDGSYNSTDVKHYGKTSGYAVIYFENDSTPKVVEFTNIKDDFLEERNIGAELRGAMRAMQIALDHKQKELTIYYDCQQVAMLVTGMYEAKENQMSGEYVKYFESIKNRINIYFSHVPSHCNIPGNEEVDKLAKLAVGITF